MNNAENLRTNCHAGMFLAGTFQRFVFNIQDSVQERVRVSGYLKDDYFKIFCHWGHNQFSYFDDIKRKPC